MTRMGGVQDISTRMMAQMLGLDIPTIDPSASYHPGYEWLPRASVTLSEPYLQPPVVGSGHGQVPFPNLDCYTGEANQVWPALSYHHDFRSPFSGGL